VGLVLGGLAFGGREEGVDDDGEEVGEHVVDESAEEGAADVEAGVGVALDQPHLHLLVDHEVQPKQLELGRRSPQQEHPGFKQHLGQPLDLSTDLALKILISADPLKIPIHLPIADFIGWFVLPIILSMFLHGIVGEMHIFIHTARGVFFAAGADVALAVEPEAVVCVEYPDADVEFAALVEQRVDVLLGDVGFVLGEGCEAAGEVGEKGGF
jgi:hypothetical protein